jgi:hypothetical protein
MGALSIGWAQVTESLALSTNITNKLLKRIGADGFVVAARRTATS